MKKSQRTTLLRVNGHQKKIFYPVIAAFLLGCVTAWLTLVYFVIGQYLAAPDFDRFHRTIPYLLVITTSLMFLVLFWTFNLTNRYLGPYERLVDDLDDVIDGDRAEELVTREGDVIFKEIIKRVNVLIRQKAERRP